MILKKGHNSTKGDNPDLKKICVHYFLMRNPYEISDLYLNKFCNGRTDGPKHAQTDKPKPICLFNFSKVGGIKIRRN